MAIETNIEWTDSTFNPWIGCTKVSPGCEHCYAEIDTPSRVFKIPWGNDAERHRTGAAKWREPKAWNNKADKFFERHGRKRRVFCASQCDIFDKRAPDQWRDDLYELIQSTPELDWLLLTKRIGNAPDWDFSKLWLGISVVNRDEYLRDVPKLLAIDAGIRFISFEPLLSDVGEIDLTGIDWVIVGGESGKGCRHMELQWARSIKRQCEAQGVAFFFKQTGGHHLGNSGKGLKTLDGETLHEWP